MRPDEAKTKWCPFSRVALTSGTSANRTASMGTGGFADLVDETRCLAEGCMAWRWRRSAGPADGDCGLAPRRD